MEGNLGRLETKGASQIHTMQQSSCGGFIGGGVDSEQEQNEERVRLEGLSFYKGIWHMRTGKGLYSVAAVVTVLHLDCCC